MVPIVCFVGKSEVGKTTLLERLVSELKKRNYTIAVIKHSGYGFELDYKGKDSWRLTQAGADAVILSSTDKLVLIKSMEHDASLEEISQLVGNSDLILTEGYRQSKAPKIEVHRKEFGSDLTCPVEELSAIVTDEVLDAALPQYSSNDIMGLADFIEKRFLAGKDQERPKIKNPA